MPTEDTDQPIADPISRKQVEVLRANAAEFGIVNFPMGDPGQGIVHVIGPEQGRTLPGMTIVCGDSHTSTHGAFGALAFGIGTSEVEHVLATQTLPQTPAAHDGDHRRRRAARRLDGQGRDPRHHRPHRHRWRHRPRRRVPRLGDPGALDGRPHDRVQHVDRGRRQGRADRPRRHDVRLPRGPARTRRRARRGTTPSTTGARSSPTTTPPSTRRSTSTPPRSARTCRGARTPARSSRSTTASPTPRRSPTPASGRPPSAPSSTWASPAARRSATSPSTPCSSARARTAASRTCGPRPTSPAGGTCRSGVRTLVVPGSWAVKAQAEAEGLDDVFRRRRLRLARARVLDVPRHEPRQARARRAVRVDVEPELRGPPGPRRAHAPRLPRRRRRHRHRRPLRHPGGPRPDGSRPHRARAPRSRSTAPTSTPTRSSRATGSSGSSAPASRRACSPSGATTRLRAQRAGVRRAPSILVAGPNFGTGSSREHAVWAIQQYGFQAVISPRFGDIFRNNCTKNGLVPVVVAGRGRRAAAAGGRGRPDARAHHRRRAPHARGAGARASSSRSRSTTPSATASSRASTTSASRSPHDADIAAFEAARPGWLPTAR